MSATTAFCICLAAPNTKFNPEPVRVFQYKTLSERRDGDYVKFDNYVDFVAGQIGGDGHESKRGEEKKRPKESASVCGTSICFAVCLMVSNN